jgi:hypothetical protein
MAGANGFGGCVYNGANKRGVERGQFRGRQEAGKTPGFWLKKQPFTAMGRRGGEV